MTIDVRIERNGDYWKLVYTHQGKRVSRSAGAIADVPRREAERRRRELAAELTADPSLLEATGDMTLAAWVARFFTLRTDLAPASARELRSTIDLLTNHLGEGRKVADITPAHAADFRLWLEKRQIKGRPISVATVRKHMRNAKTLFAHAMRHPRDTGVRINPFKGERSSVPKIMGTWAYVPIADVRKIMDAAPGPGWRAIFALARMAGLRFNEARALTWQDIRFDHPAQLIVRIPERGGRAAEADTKHDQREVPISPELRAVLLEVFESGACADGPCDGAPTTPQKASRVAQAVRKRAGVATYGKPLHTLRKSLETDWVQAFPVPTVAYWLGHSPEVMQNHYVRPTPEQIESIAGVDKGAQIRRLEAQLRALRGEPATDAAPA